MSSELVRPIVFILGGTTIFTIAKHFIKYFGFMVMAAMNFASHPTFMDTNLTPRKESVDYDVEAGDKTPHSSGSNWSRAPSRTRHSPKADSKPKHAEHFMTRKVGNVLDVQYSQARLRGILKGLASYNILENPIYRDAFAITESFAKLHKRVDDVNKMITRRKSIMVLDKEMGKLMKMGSVGMNAQAGSRQRGRGAVFIRDRGSMGSHASDAYNLSSVYSCQSKRFQF
eukprot:CAMPEP_0117867616 /NCGR_PEP_ID=MMETSP0950-20121206/8096_1 /TAXON_ID=44440 /ORGANISM="Chattonella subsalsa, Strain CCMP2191" /LENGTH=227 /DNA_ID=CAMNT_0005719237 /DNA_START=373 /DNA_END=1056 /DNA_ORIENTATION=-